MAESVRSVSRWSTGDSWKYPVEQATIKRMKTERRKGLTTMEIAGLLGAIIREEKPAKVNIDVGGLEIGVSGAPDRAGARQLGRYRR